MDIGTVERKCGRWGRDFLQRGGGFFAYYRSGLEPLKLKDPVPISEAGPETRPYVGQKAAAILSILLGEKYVNMLLFWYRKAVEREQLIPARNIYRKCWQECFNRGAKQRNENGNY